MEDIKQLRNIIVEMKMNKDQFAAMAHPIEV
jgi:hypothetical protein